MITDEEAKRIKEQLLSQMEKLPQEQVSGLKEKIQNMNNDELENFIKEKTKNVCIFCQIIKDEIKSYKIFENEKFIAVLDIMPATLGHTIILPKKHIQFLTQMSDEETNELFLLAKKIIPILINITKCQGINLFIAQGIEQKIPHLCLNLIPRYEKDGLSFEWKKQLAKEQDLVAMAKKISSVLDKISEAEHQKNEGEKQKQEESEAQKTVEQVQERIP